MKNIAVRVCDELHHAVKTFATNNGLSLQDYIVGIIEKDLRANEAYTPSLKSELNTILAELSEDDIVKVVNEMKSYASQITTKDG